MSNPENGLPFTVQVPADDWAYAQRRMTYLEAVLVQVLRDKNRIQEWYDATELASIRLPGLPTSKASITRIAKSRGWLKREIKAQGGVRFQYHYTSFPARSFDALIARILHVEPPEEHPFASPEIRPAPDEPEPVFNAAPPWVLPFMRLLKGEAQGDIGAAWMALPDNVPEGVQIPSLEDAADVLDQWGLA